MTEHIKQFTWKQDRKALKAEVVSEEKEAARILGGPVKRTEKFINGTRDFEMTWRLA